ncbi:MAG: cobaltochelatase subunit CobN, partial [Planctomycetes bacterium]|nr:cobaltochelatase subunit CobN [Planctomycetota bacterium]
MKRILLCILLTTSFGVSSLWAQEPTQEGDRLAFVGLHGGIFERLKELEGAQGLRLDYLKDSDFEAELDLSVYRVVFFQHTRKDLRDRYRTVIAAARAKNPGLRLVRLSNHGARGLFADGIVKDDLKLHAYYGTLPENLRRLLVYAGVTYLGRAGEAPPPVQVEQGSLYHPDHEGPFRDVQEFLRWSRQRGRDVEQAPRVAVVTHYGHMVLQSVKVIEALVRELERQGALALAMVDFSPRYPANLREFKPGAVVHECHSRDQVSFREQIDVPHISGLYFTRQSIDDWHQGLEGLAASRAAFLVTSQEPLGAIEPQIVAGTRSGGGSGEALTPIPERVQHLVRRTLSWVRLRRLKNADKKVAFVYYDRELGKAELMRGSATGMFLNGPRSMVKVLARMKQAGYRVDPVPQDEDELLGWLLERGRQIGVWAPGVLDRLARSGDAALVPVETYVKWLEARVPAERRAELVKSWGPAPGKFLVWKDDAGREFIVIPRVRLGNVLLLPQPLRGEAHDTSLVHSKLVPPPHNYLATYFWLEEEFGADAMVHFGTHGSEFTLPGKAVGLSRKDWCDQILGALPNLSVWVVNNTGESMPIRRRAYAVLIDHLTPPTVNAGLSDELLNLHGDIDKWEALEVGALKEKFRQRVTQQVLDEHLDRDLHLELVSSEGDRRLLSPEEVEQVSKYLHDVANETTPTSLHVLGEAPREDLLVPHLVTCLRKRFRDALAEVVAVPAEESKFDGDRDKFLRGKAEEAIGLFVRQGLSASEALEAIGAKLGEGPLPERVSEGFELAQQLKEGFERTPEEIEGLLKGLSGRFVAPGPANSPDRNPGVLPTGRNMYVMNPEELPTRPSWELGKTLTDGFLAQQLAERGRYPTKVAFDLSSFASFRDYGVMEAQILYLMGVRPVWNERSLVVDVELIPKQELGRARIDCFVFANSYYRDMLPSRLRLLDKAIRLVASLEEDGNGVREGTLAVEAKLAKAGLAAELRGRLARARIFGSPPGQMTSAGYYYLAERSGEWDSREELIQIYMEHNRYVYTEGLWGEEAGLAYEEQLRGSEVVLRTWSDRTLSPLSNKYMWWKTGSLSLAIKHLSGKEPQFFLSDVRDPDSAKMVVAEDALRQDYRVRLFNRKWIEGMMKEGYAGADQIAVHVTNTLGWKIMREGSVKDDIWEEIVEIYVRDSKGLSIREWFEAENPYAFQETSEVLLETIRKGYWKPDQATVLEIARAYARSVARHGEGGGLRGGDNTKLEAFVAEALSAPGTQELNELLAAYQAKGEESRSA